jgi:hypothetical protein
LRLPPKPQDHSFYLFVGGVFNIIVEAIGKFQTLTAGMVFIK